MAVYVARGEARPAYAAHLAINALISENSLPKLTIESRSIVDI